VKVSLILYAPHAVTTTLFSTPLSSSAFRTPPPWIIFILF
jgi:hypothetical protein